MPKPFSVILNELWLVLESQLKLKERHKAAPVRSVPLRLLVSPSFLAAAGASPLALCVPQEEDKLLALQKQTPPNGVQLSAGHFALLQVARSLEKLFLQLCLRQRFLSHSSCVGRFGLAQVPMPARALKVRLWQAKGPRRYMVQYMQPPAWPCDIAL